MYLVGKLDLLKKRLYTMLYRRRGCMGCINQEVFSLSGSGNFAKSHVVLELLESSPNKFGQASSRTPWDVVDQPG